MYGMTVLWNIINLYIIIPSIRLDIAIKYDYNNV